MVNDDTPETPEGQQWQVLDPEPTHPRRLRLPLSSADDVRRELARVYRGMKVGQIEPATGTKLAYVLNQLRVTIETSAIEQRIAALEAAQSTRR